MGSYSVNRLHSVQPPHSQTLIRHVSHFVSRSFSMSLSLGCFVDSGGAGLRVTTALEGVTHTSMSYHRSAQNLMFLKKSGRKEFYADSSIVIVGGSRVSILVFFIMARRDFNPLGLAAPNSHQSLPRLPLALQRSTLFVTCNL